MSVAISTLTQGQIVSEIISILINAITVFHFLASCFFLSMLVRGSFWAQFLVSQIVVAFRLCNVNCEI